MSQIPPSEREARKTLFRERCVLVGGCERGLARLTAGRLDHRRRRSPGGGAGGYRPGPPWRPLKTVVPLAITVDRQTGYVETQASLKPGALSQNQAVTQSYLTRYVMAREGFDATDLTGAYHQVMLWSAGGRPGPI